MDDNTLVKRILRGDKASGERFVAMQYPRIFRFLRCLTGNADTADDLTQQSFAQAWRSLDSYQGRASLATWLHKIAYREYVHWLRSRRDHLPIESAINIEDLREVRGLDSILISRAVLLLSPELREPFTLYYIQEFSIAEVGDLLELPAGTVKSRLFAARRRMRELISASEAPLAVSPPIEINIGNESSLIFSSIEGGNLS